MEEVVSRGDGRANATPQRRTQADRSAESRDRLINAAIEVLAEKGYSSTTFAEIGRRAGLSRGLVTFHFGTKEQCMLAVVEAIQVNMQAEIRRSGRGMRGLEALDLMIDKYLLIEDPRSSLYLRAMYVIIVESVTSSPGLRDAVAENNATFRQMLAEFISEAIEDGEVEAHTLPLDVATVIEGLLRGILIQCLADPEEIDLPRVTGVAQAMVRRFLAIPDSPH